MAEPKTNANPIVNWPVDDEGKPMALISYTVSEKIGLPNYSNVDVGPATITKFVKEGDEVTELNSVADTIEKDVLAVQRSTVLEIVRKQQTS